MQFKHSSIVVAVTTTPASKTTPVPAVALKTYPGKCSDGGVSVGHKATAQDCVNTCGHTSGCVAADYRSDQTCDLHNYMCPALRPESGCTQYQVWACCMYTALCSTWIQTLKYYCLKLN